MVFVVTLVYLWNLLEGSRTLIVNVNVQVGM